MDSPCPQTNEAAILEVSLTEVVEEELIKIEAQASIVPMEAHVWVTVKGIQEDMRVAEEEDIEEASNIAEAAVTKYLRHTLIVTLTRCRYHPVPLSRHTSTLLSWTRLIPNQQVSRN